MPGQEVTQSELCRTQTDERFHPWLCTPWVSSALVLHSILFKGSFVPASLLWFGRKLRTYRSMCGAAVSHMFSCTEKPSVRVCWWLWGRTNSVTEESCVICFSKVCVDDNQAWVQCRRLILTGKTSWTPVTGMDLMTTSVLHSLTNRHLKLINARQKKPSVLLPKWISKGLF